MIDSEPILSVIIPVYNVEKYLAECLDSALAQTLTDLEIICVDDGSTDSSGAILDGYARRDPRIRVIHKANAGFGHTMNCGLRAATGKYVAFLESDDFIVPEAYSELVARAEKTGADIVKGDCYEVYGEKPDYVMKLAPVCRRRKGYYNRNLSPREDPVVFEFYILNQLGVFRRSFLAEHKILHNETPGASYQDNGFWFQTFCWAKSVHFVNKPYYCHRNGRPDASMSQLQKFEKAICIRDEYRFNWSVLETHKNELSWAMPIYFRRMLRCFLIRYRKINANEQSRFLTEVFRAELLVCQARPTWTVSALDWFERCLWRQIVDAPDRFHRMWARGGFGDLLWRMIECYHDEGLLYTAKRLFALGRK